MKSRKVEMMKIIVERDDLPLHFFIPGRFPCYLFFTPSKVTALRAKSTAYAAKMEK
jgi:hypothetical protein